MKTNFVYIGILILLVGAGLGTYWINSSLSQNTVGYGSAFPTPSYSPPAENGLAFYSPENGSTTFTVSYLYADSSASVFLVRCDTPGPSCGSGGVSAPLRSESGAYNITGANGVGTWQEPGGFSNWYVVETNEPVVVIVKVPLSTESLAIEITAIVGTAGGLGLFVAGLLLRDPNHRPTPRVTQLKRTLYFFVQNKLAVVGLAILLFFVFVAILAPVLAPFAPTFYTTGNANTGNAAYDQIPFYCAISASPPFSPISVEGCTGGTPQAVCSALPCAGGDVLTPPAGSYVDVLTPTWSYSSLVSPGQLPLGSLAGEPSGAYYINTYQSLIRATPWDLFFSSVIVLSGAAIGIFLGSLAGYLGGMVDEAIMRLTDIFLSIPALLLTIVILVAVHAANPTTSENTTIALLMVSFIVVWWPAYTRLVRGQVLVTREQKYVEAARASGASSGRIISKHIIPNSVYPVFVSISLDVGTIPLLLGALAFLGFNKAIGFGVPQHELPTFPEWGGIASAGVNPAFIQTLFTNFRTTNPVPFPWWQFLYPGLTLFLFAIAVNFLSDGLRDALDPRLRR